MLTGSGVLGHTGFDADAVQRQVDTLLARKAQMSAMLVLETDAPEDIEDAQRDINVICQRLAVFQYNVIVLENKDHHVILQVTGPQLNKNTLARLTAGGKFMIGAIDDPDHWKDLITDAHLKSQEVEWTALTVGEEPSFAAQNKDALRPLANVLTAQSLLPFIYCRGQEPTDHGCILHVLKSDIRLMNEDIIAAAPEVQVQYDAVFLQQQITLTPNAAQRFKMLTAQNLKKPLPILLDGDVLSMPIVQTIIEDGKLQITNGVVSPVTSIEQKGLDALIFHTLILHPPLVRTWRLVHMAEVNLPK